jgi:hypothetical protein
MHSDAAVADALGKNVGFLAGFMKFRLSGCGRDRADRRREAS